MADPETVSAALYTRQEFVALTGLDDSILNYWMREGLLRPVDGGGGKGRHRRFDFIQVNIAAILGQLRPFGLNISALRSLAAMLQDAADIGADRSLHPGSYTAAANLANQVNKFRTGETVLIRAHGYDADPPATLQRQAATAWRMESRPADNEQEIIDDFLASCFLDYDDPELIVAKSRQIGPNKSDLAKIYVELVSNILAPGYALPYGWLLGFQPDGSWRVAHGDEGHFFNSISGPNVEDFGPGIFLPVSGVFRKIWGLNSAEQYLREQEAMHVVERLALKGITVTATPSDNAEVGPTIHYGDEYTWDEIEAALAKPFSRRAQKSDIG